MGPRGIFQLVISAASTPSSRERSRDKGAFSQRLRWRRGSLQPGSCLPAPAAPEKPAAAQLGPGVCQECASKLLGKRDEDI